MSKQSDSQGVTIQACKHCGAGAPLEAHFCPQCDKILSFVRHGDYFTFLGLPRKLRIDLTDLDRRLRTLSRQFHPDYYCNATAAERLASLERASYLNDAYRTLRDPLTRIEYLLQIEGVPLRKRVESAGGVPAALLEEVFALNEELDAVREAREAGRVDAGVRARLAAARAPIDRHVTQHERRLEQLMDQWDAMAEQGAPASDRRPLLEDIKGLLLERNYVNNLLAAIEKESGELA